MIRSLLVSVAGAALLALPVGASAAPVVPPGYALVGHDAAGNAVAVWAVAGTGELVTSRSLAGSGTWSRTVTLYTPSKFCRFQGRRCTSESVTPTGLVVNAAGQAFFAVVQSITDPASHCGRIVAGRASTNRNGGEIGALSIAYMECPANDGSIRDARTAISADGTGALGWWRVTPSYPGRDDVDLAVYPRGSVTASASTSRDLPRIDSPDLQVGIDDLDRATLVYRDLGAPSFLRSVDLIGTAATDELVSPRSGVGRPLLVVNPDGTQVVTYQGAAFVGQAWVRGTVSQTRSAAGQPWSAPVLLGP